MFVLALSAPLSNTKNLLPDLGCSSKSNHLVDTNVCEAVYTSAQGKALRRAVKFATMRTEHKGVPFITGTTTLAKLTHIAYSV
jgi:hypothetical protein